MNCVTAKGFTLMELLVVIAITGSLAALLLPALSSVKDHARSTSCRNHQHQMGLALQMYMHDHQNRFPYYLGPPGPAYGDATGLGGAAKDGVYWSSQLQPYCSMRWTNSAFHCPGYKGANAGPEYYEAQGGIDRLGSYGYNLRGVRSDDHTNGYFGLGPVVFWRTAHAVSEAEVKVPSEMFAIGESRFLNASANQAPGGKDTLTCGEPGEPFNPARHGKNYNQLFVDGHVSGISPSVLFNPTNTGSLWNYDHQPHPELWIP
jgi:prepilin-type N-terminal cleavage/methylation domain-containing protein/prepilin-type processing-associated H-X9-DG protein